MISEETIGEKIRDIIHSNNENDLVDTIVLILKELAVSPESVDALSLIDKKIDLICEEKFG